MEGKTMIKSPGAGQTERQIVMVVGDTHIDRRVLDEARSLIHDGWSVTVIALPAPQNIDLLTEQAFPEVEVVRISADSTNRLSALLDLSALRATMDRFPSYSWQEVFPNFIHQVIEAVSRPAAIYVAHDLPQLPAALFAATFHNAKLVYDAHEIYPEQGFPDTQRNLYEKIERVLIPYADEVITISESAADILENGYPVERPHVILNCTSTHGRPVPVPRTRFLAKRLSIDERMRILLFQGNLSLKTRNLENVIEGVARSKHSDVALVFVGPPGGPEVLPGLASIAEQHGLLGKRVFFHEAISQQMLLEATASADAGIIPYVPTNLNTRICTPNKLFEFLVAGVPLLANDLVELNRFVSGQGVGLNRNLNSAVDIQRALDEFFDCDLDLFRERYKQIAPLYDWNIQGSKIQKIYQELSSRSSLDAGRNVLPLKEIQSAARYARRGNFDGARKILTGALERCSQLESQAVKVRQSSQAPRLRIATIVGARPQFIKASVLSHRIAQDGRISEAIVHTGQHYDAEMNEVFFKELEIPRPQAFLQVGSGRHGEQTGAMLSKIEAYLEGARPDLVLVYGDTNSTLAGALAAAKLQIPVAHVEAGLRAFTRFKPEEINRILTDHCSDILFPPTSSAEQQLRKEGLSGRHIEMVGDLMYDLALLMAPKAEARRNLMRELKLETKKFALCSLHRAENTDSRERLTALVECLNLFCYDIPIVIPLHPRTRKCLEQHGLRLDERGIRIVPPLGYLDMQLLEKEAKLILTDSGGVQKEAYFHGVPCVTLRDETEWRELLVTGWNTLCPITHSSSMVSTIRSISGRDFSSTARPALYGDGSAAKKIVDYLVRLAESGSLQAPDGVDVCAQ